MTRLITGDSACYVRTFRGSTAATCGTGFQRLDVSQRHTFLNTASDLRKRCSVRGAAVPRERVLHRERPACHNLWTKLWTHGRAGNRPSAARTRGRRGDPAWRAATEPRGGTDLSASDLAERVAQPGRRPAAQPARLAPLQQPVTLHENTAIVAVPDDFTRSQLETRLRTRLEDAPERTPSASRSGSRSPSTRQLGDRRHRPTERSLEPPTAPTESPRSGRPADEDRLSTCRLR